MADALSVAITRTKPLDLVEAHPHRARIIVHPVRRYPHRSHKNAAHPSHRSALWFQLLAMSDHDRLVPPRSCDSQRARDETIRRRSTLKFSSRERHSSFVGPARARSGLRTTVVSRCTQCAVAICNDGHRSAGFPIACRRAAAMHGVRRPSLVRRSVLVCILRPIVIQRARYQVYVSGASDGRDFVVAHRLINESMLRATSDPRAISSPCKAGRPSSAPVVRRARQTSAAPGVETVEMEGSGGWGLR